MQRKDFVKLLLPVSLAGSGIANTLKPGESADYHLPDTLVAGDTIGITTPAGWMSSSEIEPAIQLLQSWGFRIVIGKTIGLQENTFGGTDAERKADLQNMLNDENIKAIMCARGGYGTIRIIDDLDFSIFKKKPKWLIGFSDITVLHCHIFRHTKIASIHSKMCNSFPAVWADADKVQQQTIDSIRQILTGTRLTYENPLHPQNIVGSGKGKLIGGNLRTLENLAGSKSSPCTENCILFVEDTGEYLYSIDRMFYNLLRSGKLDKLKGLIIGGFKIKPDDEGDIFGKTLEDIVLQKVKEFNYPVCFNFPVGHQKNNMPLVCGAMHELTVTATACRLTAIY